MWALHPQTKLQAFTPILFIPLNLIPVLKFSFRFEKWLLSSSRSIGYPKVYKGILRLLMMGKSLW